MNKTELTMLQALPLEVKIMKSKQRIREFVDHMGGEERVYISFSGGKDSTVLLDLVRQEFPNVKAIYCDTGLEYPEIKQFVKSHKNIEIIRPKYNFREVLTKYGYPVVSKEQSQFISEYRNTKSDKLKDIRLNGNKWGRGKISKKHFYLVSAPFKISNKCCDVMKKNPFKAIEKERDIRPIVGVMAEESQLRVQQYLKSGCNSFESKRQQCKPMGFWREQDVLEYIKVFNLRYASVYGELEEKEGKLKFTKCQRTGCVYCLYGIERDEEENRLQRLEKTHPQLHEYCIKNLGLQEVCEFMGVKYTSEEG